MYIIFPGLTYTEALQKANIETLEDRRSKICKAFFQKIQNKDNVLNHLLPRERDLTLRLRKTNKYELPKCRTERYKNTFIPFSLYNFQ